MILAGFLACHNFFRGRGGHTGPARCPACQVNFWVLGDESGFTGLAGCFAWHQLCDVLEAP